ncbi:class I SAM-dependent methyltransferase [Nocardioides houyundeii]|uniref:class I SAM-dependent methyltransferase n=1 Tax=Nocardioides houyundeii TaxID=2045452 RepID=UPI000C7602F7|nr:methyltransferase domain-containing protein [Nocardioides houyundeii]
MSSQDVTPVTGGTAPSDYAESYYARVLNGAEGEYTWDNPSWREHSRSLADRLIALANPKTTLDVGCAKGLLVQALAEKGVDARGIDISEHALAGAHPEVRPRLDLSSAARPLEGRFDLITCLEVVEHLDPRAARASIDAMCAATDRVLFSSTPHQSPRPPTSTCVPPRSGQPRSPSVGSTDAPTSTWTSSPHGRCCSSARSSNRATSCTVTSPAWSTSPAS